jgi:hypothetical protein
MVCCSLVWCTYVRQNMAATSKRSRTLADPELLGVDCVPAEPTGVGLQVACRWVDDMT